MHAAYVLVALVSAGAPRGADRPEEPGASRERTAEMQLRRVAASLQEDAGRQQAAAEEALGQSCDAALDAMDAVTIATLPPCKAKKAAFCRRLASREGLALVLDRGEPAKGEAAKLCGKDLARLQAALCPAAARDYAKGGPRGAEALVFLGTSCPAEATPIAKRACAGRSYTDLEGALREFCTAYARRGLDEGEVKPARAPRAEEELERGEIPKGLPGK